ncbi:MAG: HEAT repeat domain-containing protein [Candidatus Thiodiazotropha sp. (ex Monitilora ramsayi)]|nr:HEAT repeat domain-containing protein [Candidatus Thiodiazotropha sp. (ex Monitilora ramsayi)]
MNTSLETETVEVLCELLQTGDEADRCYAARTLGVLRSRSAMPYLIERLRDEDVDVCVDAAEALGKIADESAVPALIDSLQNETSGEISSMVTEALGRIANTDCVDVLLEVLTERPEGLEWDGDWDTWWDIQLEAVKALGAAGAEEAVESLVAFIDDEASQDIENEVLTALVAISGPGLTKVIERQQNTANKTLSRRRATRALAGAKTPEATKVLGRALQDKDPEVRAEAVQALAAKKEERYLSALLLLLRDQSPEVRDAAIRAVTELAGQASLQGDLQETLLMMLNDPSSLVRATLFNILVPVVGENPLSNEYFKIVVASTFENSAETATAACRLLGKNGNAEAITTLLEHIRNEDGHPMVRREAILAMGEFGEISDDIIDALIHAVGDAQQPVRLAALTTLMSLDPQYGNVNIDDDEQTSLPRPLSIVIDAVNGAIRVPGDTQSSDKPVEDEEIQMESEAPQSDAVQNGVVVDFEPNMERQFFETTSGNETLTNPVPEEIAETIKLPETPARIVEEGEVAPAMSTLDAIAIENVEMMLGEDKAEQETPETDETTQEYLDVVEANKAEMKRIRASKRITPDQDVRLLGARVLAAANDDEAIDALITALSDEDDLIRREAAEAIGEIALRNPGNPKLMDSVGTLITQLAVGDLEQKITCARSLSFLGNRSALVPLIDALNDPQPNVRIAAIQSLARLTIFGLDPKDSGHMVVREVPAISVARKLLRCLSDDNIGVRVAATNALSKVLAEVQDQQLTEQSIEKIIASVVEFTGEEARQIGQALRAFDSTISNRTLLTKLRTAEDSIKRSVYIEMIEEILNPDQRRPERVV